MKAKKNCSLPRRSVLVLDATLTLRNSIRRKVQEQLGQSMHVKTFASADAASKFILREKETKDLEPVLVITDRIGLDEHSGFALQIRKRFPLAKVILNSRTLSSQAARKMMRGKQPLVDKYVSKNQPSKLLPTIVACHKSYCEHLVNEIRVYIETCPNPSTPFMSANEGTHVSMMDVYSHILKQTRLGKEFQAAWEASSLLLMR